MTPPCVTGERKLPQVIVASPMLPSLYRSTYANSMPSAVPSPVVGELANEGDRLVTLFRCFSLPLTGWLRLSTCKGGCGSYWRYPLDKEPVDDGAAIASESRKWIWR